MSNNSNNLNLHNSNRKRRFEVAFSGSSNFPSALENKDTQKSSNSNLIILNPFGSANNNFPNHNNTSFNGNFPERKIIKFNKKFYPLNNTNFSANQNVNPQISSFPINNQQNNNIINNDSIENFLNDNLMDKILSEVSQYNRIEDVKFYLKKTILNIISKKTFLKFIF